MYTPSPVCINQFNSGAPLRREPENLVHPYLAEVIRRAIDEAFTVSVSFDIINNSGRASENDELHRRNPLPLRPSTSDPDTAASDSDAAGCA